MSESGFDSSLRRLNTDGTVMNSEMATLLVQTFEHRGAMAPASPPASAPGSHADDTGDQQVVKT
jgi:hypothetical protein